MESLAMRLVFRPRPQWLPQPQQSKLLKRPPHRGRRVRLQRQRSSLLPSHRRKRVHPRQLSRRQM